MPVGCLGRLVFHLISSKALCLHRNKYLFTLTLCSLHFKNWEPLEGFEPPTIISMTPTVAETRLMLAEPSRQRYPQLSGINHTITLISICQGKILGRAYSGLTISLPRMACIARLMPTQLLMLSRVIAFGRAAHAFLANKPCRGIAYPHRHVPKGAPIKLRALPPLPAYPLSCSRGKPQTVNVIVPSKPVAVLLLIES